MNDNIEQTTGIMHDDFPGIDRYQTATAAMRARADRRLEILKAWWEFRDRSGRKNKSKADKDFVVAFNIQHPDEKVSRATLHRWDKAHKQDGRSGLIENYSRQANHVAEFTIEAKAFLESQWLDESRRDIYSCYQNLLIVARLNNWKVPHYSTCRRHLKKLSRDVVILLREGQTAFHNKAFPSIKRDRNSVNVGQVYVMDDRILDVSYGAGREGERLWVTACADMRSRKIVALVITAKGNDTQAVLDVFYSAALEHIPDELIIDNGGNYREAGFVKIDEQNPIPENLQAPLVKIVVAKNIHWALPGNARTKIIERIFRDMSRLHDKNLPGYTGWNVLNRPEGWYLQRENGEFLPRAEIIKTIRHWCFEKYNNWATKGGQSPNEIWAEHFSGKPYRRAEPQYLRHLLLRTWPKPIKLRTDGIQFGKFCTCRKSPNKCKCPARFYWDESLQLLCGNIKEVLVKYNDNDPRQIWIYKKDGTPIAEVPLYNFQNLPALRAGEKVGQYQKIKKHRKNEILAIKSRLQDLHNLNLTSDELMDRADIQPAPLENIDMNTGELIEQVKNIELDVQLPPSIDSRRRTFSKIKKSVEHVDYVLSTLKTQASKDSDAWKKLDSIMNG